MDKGEFPTLLKIQECGKQSIVIQNFMEFIIYEKGYNLTDEYGDCYDADLESLLYEFFGIDQDKAEEERQRMLAKYVRGGDNA